MQNLICSKVNITSQCPETPGVFWTWWSPKHPETVRISPSNARSFLRILGVHPEKETGQHVPSACPVAGLGSEWGNTSQSATANKQVESSCLSCCHFSLGSVKWIGLDMVRIYHASTDVYQYLALQFKFRWFRCHTSPHVYHPKRWKWKIQPASYGFAKVTAGNQGDQGTDPAKRQRARNEWHIQSATAATMPPVAGNAVSGIPSSEWVIILHTWLENHRKTIGKWRISPW